MKYDEFIARVAQNVGVPRAEADKLKPASAGFQAARRAADGLINGSSGKRSPMRGDTVRRAVCLAAPSIDSRGDKLRPALRRTHSSPLD